MLGSCGEVNLLVVDFTGLTDAAKPLSVRLKNEFCLVEPWRCEACVGEEIGKEDREE